MKDMRHVLIFFELGMTFENKLTQIVPDIIGVLHYETVQWVFSRPSGHGHSCDLRQSSNTIGEIIYTCKMIQPGIFSRFSQPVLFSRFKPDNLLLSTARFSGYNLEKNTG
jgi:hypothetical protein